MNFEDYETLPTSCVTTNMAAGAIAGVMEHCVMYPLDSVKTRMQSLVPTSANGSHYRGISEALVQMVTKEGVLRPMRGMGVVVIGAGPAHALYFSSYEYIRDSAVQNFVLNTTLASGLSGCISTLVHDGVMTPADVVKQRLQMYNSPYKSVIECIGRVYEMEGLRAFYRSYTTQLVMNIPFQCIHFMTYEFCQTITNKEKVYNPVAHMVSGAIAGGVAAAITTPLDVCKTLLNTQLPQVKVAGLFNAIRTVYAIGGPLGYFRGLSARVLFQMPSTAICWSTYEFFKYLLTGKLLDPKISVEHETVTDDEGTFYITSRQNPSSVITQKSEITSRSIKSAPARSCELPAISSSSVLGTLSLPTLHTSENVTTNTLMDIRRR